MPKVFATDEERKAYKLYQQFGTDVSQTDTPSGFSALKGDVNGRI